MDKKVIIISSGQPSLNPRLVKEADALADAGYKVTVLYAYWNKWGTGHDKQLLPQKKWKAIRVGGDPEEQPVIFFLSRLIHKFARFSTTKFESRYFLDFAIARSSFFLINAAKKHNADLYIGHNLGALPATVKAAKANNKRCGFDTEDFHRFEISDDSNDSDVILKVNIENRYLPQTDYLSASSPLIADAYEKLYPGKHPITILNVFPTEISIKLARLNPSAALKLFWFSQTIGVNRGIENVIEALKYLKTYNIELHLLGYIEPEDQIEFVNNLKANDLKIYFHDPLPSEKIAEFASQFDIGLATENSTPFNRDICLTNKIFTYMQAGLAIVASDTKAQIRLLNEYPSIGQVYKRDDINLLADVLLDYYEDREKLLNTRKSSLNIGQTKLNWENEAPKLLRHIENLFHNQA